MFFHKDSHQRDPQSITAPIITTPPGHVSLKPQPRPPFWLLRHFAAQRQQEASKSPKPVSVHGAAPRWCLATLCVAHRVLVSLWTPRLPLATGAAVVLPAVLVWSVDEQAAARSKAAGLRLAPGPRSEAKGDKSVCKRHRTPPHTHTHAKS